MIITNNITSNLDDFFTKQSKELSKIDIVVAFLSDTEFIEKWDKENVQINIIVALCPPTNYYSLKKISTLKNVDIRFLDSQLHSKFYLMQFNTKEDIGIVGSSNLSLNGLINNFETNLITKTQSEISTLKSHFNTLLDKSRILEIEDLEEYKEIFLKYKKRQNQNDLDIGKFQRRKRRVNLKKERTRISKEALEYHKFRNIVNDIREIVYPILIKEYPKTPVYIVIDQFFQWIEVHSGKEIRITIKNKEQDIRKYFKKFCNWDKKHENLVKEMDIRSKNTFQKYLSIKSIDKLKDKDAKLVYSSLHAGNLQTRRFNSDENFIKDNGIVKIKTSLKYLLHSDDEISLRIHNLYRNKKYSLSKFGYSCIQEIISWVKPNLYPLKNGKAKRAIKTLRYEIE